MAEVEERLEGRALTLRFEGPISGAASARVYRALQAARSQAGVDQVVLELPPDTRIDSATVVAAVRGAEALERAGKRLRLSPLTASQEAAFRMIPAPHEMPRSAAEPPLPARALAALGQQTISGLETLGRFVALIGAGLRQLGRAALGRAPLRVGAIVDQATHMGIGALGLVVVLSATLGVVLSLQSVVQLRFFGVEIFVADIVGIGMVREFGPFLTAIILAGRSSTGVAAEIGTMAVREEIDALETMGIDPVGFLVLPRVAGILIAQPVLTVFSMASGIAGGVGYAAAIGIPPSVYYARLREAVMADDFVSGLTKSVLFALIVVFSGVFMGLRTRGGATAVGRSTTAAVVTAISLIIVVDSIASAVLLGVS